MIFLNAFIKDENIVLKIIESQEPCDFNLNNIEKLLNKKISLQLKSAVIGINIYLKCYKDKKVKSDLLVFGHIIQEADNNYAPEIEVFYDIIADNCNHQKEFELNIVHTILHELAHSYMNPDPIDNTPDALFYSGMPLHALYYSENSWYKTMEESLCNYIAYSQNWKKEEKKYFREQIPVLDDDYSCFLNFKQEALVVAKQWKTFKTNTILDSSTNLWESVADHQQVIEYAERLKTNTLTQSSSFGSIGLTEEDKLYFMEKFNDPYYLTRVNFRV